jgi:hypothetical protein
VTDLFGNSKDDTRQQKNDPIFMPARSYRPPLNFLAEILEKEKLKKNLLRTFKAFLG